MRHLSDLRHFRRGRRAFTVIEIMIVVVAMAILAGIIIPQVGDAVAEAQYTAMLYDSHMLTNAIERYKVHHFGQPPNNLAGETLMQLGAQTDASGNLGAGPSYPFGPYLLEDIPANPLNGDPRVYAVSEAPPADLQEKTGWLYHVPTGQIWGGEKRRRPSL